MFLSSGGYSVDSEFSGLVPLDRMIIFFCTGIRQRTLVRAPYRSRMDMCSLSGYPHSFTVRKGEWSDCIVQNKGDFRKDVVAAAEVLPDSDCYVALQAFLGPQGPQLPVWK